MQSTLPDSPPRDRGRLPFLASLLAIGGLFGLIAVLAGRHLMISNLVWPSDVLFGFDIARNIEVMTQFSIKRTNVHPFIGLMTRPFTYLVRLTGVTTGMSAVIVTAGAGVLALWLTAFYLRLRGVSRLDTLLLILLMAGSTTWLFESALPGTYIFSFVTLTLAHILLVISLRRPAAELPSQARFARETTWVLLGLANYGTTVTMGAMWFLAYGFSLAGGWKRWFRAIGMGLLVFVLGILLAMAVGSWINLQSESQFVAGGELYGSPPAFPILRSASTALVWSFVAPIAQLVTLEDARHWTIVTFIRWEYTPAGWLLVAAWGLLLAAAAWQAARPAGLIPRRLNAALAACLLFHIVLHGFYMVAKEGTFCFSAHSIFLVIGLMAPLAARAATWPAPGRTLFRVALLALAILLTLRHINLIWALPDFVPLPADFLAGS